MKIEFDINIANAVTSVLSNICCIKYIRRERWSSRTSWWQLLSLLSYILQFSLCQICECLCVFNLYYNFLCFWNHSPEVEVINFVLSLNFLIIDTSFYQLVSEHSDLRKIDGFNKENEITHWVSWASFWGVSCHVIVTGTEYGRRMQGMLGKVKIVTSLVWNSTCNFCVQNSKWQHRGRTVVLCINLIAETMKKGGRNWKFLILRSLVNR
jgi:hypothetical protein